MLSSRTSLLPSPPKLLTDMTSVNFVDPRPCQAPLSCRQFGVQPKSRDGIALEPAAQLAMALTPESGPFLPQLSSEARIAKACCGQHWFEENAMNFALDCDSFSVIRTFICCNRCCFCHFRFSCSMCACTVVMLMS